MAESDSVQSPLLRLPGELRNLIYVYATETSTIALCAPAGSDRTLDSTSKATERQWFGLTQVCKQIRSEFLPIYREATNHQVDLGDVPAYADTFIPNYASGGADVIGRLTIDLRMRNSDGHPMLASVDILPLLKICLSQPPCASKLRVTFIDGEIVQPNGKIYRNLGDPHSGNNCQDLTALFHPRADQKWKAFAMRYISSFVVNLATGMLPNCKMGISRDYFYGGQRLGSDFLPIVGGYRCFDDLRHRTRKTWAMSLRTPMGSLGATMDISIE